MPGTGRRRRSPTSSCNRAPVPQSASASARSCGPMWNAVSRRHISIPSRHRSGRSERSIGILKSAHIAARPLPLSLASCTGNAPAKVSGCTIQSVAAPGGFVLIRRWEVTNIGAPEIDATRIAVSVWPDQEIPESRAGGLIWDDEVPLSPGKAHVVVQPPTDPIAERRFREPTPFHCKVCRDQIYRWLCVARAPGTC